MPTAVNPDYFTTCWKYYQSHVKTHHQHKHQQKSPVQWPLVLVMCCTTFYKILSSTLILTNKNVFCFHSSLSYILSPWAHKNFQHSNNKHWNPFSIHRNLFIISRTIQLTLWNCQFLFIILITSCEKRLYRSNRTLYYDNYKKLVLTTPKMFIARRKYFHTQLTHSRLTNAKTTTDKITIKVI